MVQMQDSRWQSILCRHLKIQLPYVLRYDGYVLNRIHTSPTAFDRYWSNGTAFTTVFRNQTSNYHDFGNWAVSDWRNAFYTWVGTSSQTLVGVGFETKYWQQFFSLYSVTNFFIRHRPSFTNLQWDVECRLTLATCRPKIIVLSSVVLFCSVSVDRKFTIKIECFEVRKWTRHAVARYTGVPWLHRRVGFYVCEIRQNMNSWLT